MWVVADSSTTALTVLSMTSPAAHRSVNPSEVGWQFVPQYYTFVNKQPDRLHQFYTKKSTFMHGTEGDDGKPCLGQQVSAIGRMTRRRPALTKIVLRVGNPPQKITAIGFQDCKVFIHSVDAQSSADGGIIIQVIGEMSNRSDPWRKFVQTFFLAEQPNGYFVLNDIFRFLKEETVDDEASDVADAEPVAVVEHAPVVTAVVPEPARDPTPPPPPAPEPEPIPEPVEEVPEPVPEPPQKVQQVATPEPTAPVTPQPNGVHREATPVIEKAATPSPVPAPAVVAAPPPPVAATPAPAPAPAPAQPPQPKTWANLAAANSKKWGAAVAQDSRGTSEVAPSAPAQPTPAAAPAPQRAPQGQHPNYTAAMSVTTAQCFVKGVVEPITTTLLTNHLTTHFGPMKDLEIVRSKACAFFEFNSLDAARRAIATCLPQSQGGEGGVWIDCGDGITQRISIETRKERSERPAPRPRGGAPMGEGRGGDGRGRGGSDFRGRGRGAGRGAPAAK
ncbi:NTF2 domain-containing protein [Mycena chlorophos]|uniref:NTF2 domain-containing protein n=1 Tax=Mycena chlorophos TaxID=658473 RepID=A0A8H6WHN2_MYCCL|nr:NTF2 domain-containing protein [Mycena chlorophos]